MSALAWEQGVMGMGKVMSTSMATGSGLARVTASGLARASGQGSEKGTAMVTPDPGCCLQTEQCACATGRERSSTTPMQRDSQFPQKCSSAAVCRTYLSLEKCSKAEAHGLEQGYAEQGGMASPAAMVAYRGFRPTVRRYAVLVKSMVTQSSKTMPPVSPLFQFQFHLSKPHCCTGQRSCQPAVRAHLQLVVGYEHDLITGVVGQNAGR